MQVHLEHLLLLRRQVGGATCSLVRRLTNGFIRRRNRLNSSVLPCFSIGIA